MLKILSRIIVFTQILNICFSSNQLETLLLENNNSQMEPQNQAITNFLIYPYPNTFKEYILPFVSSENAIKLFLLFQTLNSNIEFEAFLPPTRFITSYPVLTLQETDILYKFDKEFYPLFNLPIWFSKKNKLPKIVSIWTNFQSQISQDPTYYGPRDVTVYAIFSDDKIVCLNYRSTATSPTCRHLWAAKNVETQEFFVALKKDDNTFETLANGKIFDYNTDLDNRNFPEHLQLIWDAYHLKGLKKYFFKMIYFLQIVCLLPYSKYFFFLVRGFINFINFSCRRHCKAANAFSVFIPVLFILVFHLVLLPFHIMAIPFYMYTQNCWLPMFLPEVLFLIHASFFPQLVQICFNHKIRKGNFDLLLSMTQNFEIQPKEQNNMWAIPSLLQKNQFPLYLLRGLFLIYVIMGLGSILSLPFLVICSLNDGEN